LLNFSSCVVCAFGARQLFTALIVIPHGLIFPDVATFGSGLIHDSPSKMRLFVPSLSP
jgi:hypothetical protein